MFSKRAAVAVFSVSLALAPCFAQSTAADRAQITKDELELQSYVLTMENVTHTFQATHALNEAAKADPALKNSLKDDDSGSQKSLDQMVAKVSTSPKVVTVLASFGLTPRTYTLTMMSVITTGIAVAALDAGAKMEDLVKVHVSPTNVAFVRAHKVELDELGKKYPLNESSD